MAAAAAETCSLELRTAGYLAKDCWTAWSIVRESCWLFAPIPVINNSKIGAIRMLIKDVPIVDKGSLCQCRSKREPRLQLQHPVVRGFQEICAAEYGSAGVATVFLISRESP